MESILIIFAAVILYIIRQKVLMKNERFRNFVNNKYVKIASYIIMSAGILALLYTVYSPAIKSNFGF